MESLRNVEIIRDVEFVKVILCRSTKHVPKCTPNFIMSNEDIPPLLILLYIIIYVYTVK